MAMKQDSSIELRVRTPRDVEIVTPPALLTRAQDGPIAFSIIGKMVQIYCIVVPKIDTGSGSIIFLAAHQGAA